MSIIFLLVLFQIKHYFCDFHLQTQDQIKTKGQYGNLVGLGHTLEHTIGTMVILIPFLMLHPVVLLLCALFDTVVHYHTDYVKMRFGNKNIAEPVFWHQLGQDQLVHQLTYLAIAFVVHTQICGL